jgi:tetratricopeptide (TPR) repeat protein
MDTITALLELATKNHQAGFLDQAEQLYRQIVDLAPSFPDLWRVWYLLGDLCQAQDRKVEAVESFCRSLQLKPDGGPAHNRLGVVLSALGKHVEAEEHFRRALDLQDSSAGIHGNLGNSLSAQGKLAEAEEAYRLAVQAQPGDANLQVCLAYVLALQKKVDQALACYQEAGRLAPGSPLVHAVWGSFLIALGRIDEAVGRLQEALRLDPACAHAWGCLSELAKENCYALSAAEIDKLRNLVLDASRPLSDQITLQFALGTVLDKLGHYDEAFTHFRCGNDLKEQRLRSQGRAFDPGRHRRLIDDLMSAYTAEHFQRTAGFGLMSDKPVFIVGVPRSGTTLVNQILSAHPQVAAAGELQEMQMIAAELPRLLSGSCRSEYVPRLDRPLAQTLAERYLHRLHQLGGTSERISDKTPENYFHLGLIATLFPRARIIHCRRDPLDTCISCYTTNFQDVRFSTSLENLGEYYRAYEKLMNHWRAVLPVPIHAVQYEDLVARQEPVERDLVAYCGLEWNENCLRFHEAREVVYTSSRIQVRQPVYSHSVGRWRRYERHLGGLHWAIRKQSTAL